MIWDNRGLENTENRIKDSLDLLSCIHEFKYCLVNMSDVERRLEERDLGLLSALSEKEIEHLEQLRIKKNKIQWIAGRYAVKSALYKYKMVGPSCIDVLKGEDSAPYILQYPDLCASITHSYPYCIGMVARKKIGVDIEEIRELEGSVLEHFFTSNEREQLTLLKGTEDYVRRTIIYWTRKEAASKLVKLGMKLDFKELDTSKDLVSIDNCRIQFKSILFKDFCVSIAVEEDAS